MAREQNTANEKAIKELTLEKETLADSLKQQETARSQVEVRTSD